MHSLWSVEAFKLQLQTSKALQKEASQLHPTADSLVPSGGVKVWHMRICNATLLRTAYFKSACTEVASPHHKFRIKIEK